MGASKSKDSGLTSSTLRCLLDSLADVELQLVLQWLDTTSKLVAARCSRRLLLAASHSFAWKDAPPWVVEARTAADIERMRFSLPRFASIHLRCIGMESLECVVAVPHLHGLELQESPVAAAASTSLEQLLQHPCAERLQTLRLGIRTFSLEAISRMRLIARLPQLRTLHLSLPNETEAATSAPLLQPLEDAPALVDLSLGWYGAGARSAVRRSIRQVAGLRRLRLRGLIDWKSGAFRSLFCSPNIRQLQHLELKFFFVKPCFGLDTPGAAEFEAAFRAMQQLQSLALDLAFGINDLLPHLRHAKQLRLVTVRCRPCWTDMPGMDWHPNRGTLVALLDAAPQLELRLQLPASLRGYLDQLTQHDLSFLTKLWRGCIAVRQWRVLQHMAVEGERVAIDVVQFDEGVFDVAAQ